MGEEREVVSSVWDSCLGLLHFTEGTKTTTVPIQPQHSIFSRSARTLSVKLRQTLPPCQLSSLPNPLLAIHLFD